MSTSSEIGPMRSIASTLPTANGDAKRMWFGATEPGIVKFEIVGPRISVLSGAADGIVEAGRNIPGTVGIKQDWENEARSS